jgi:hypothetical protein
MSALPLLITVASFVAVSHPATYKLTGGLLGSWVASADGLPKIGGLLLHSIVFLLLLGLLYTLLMPKRSGFSVTIPFTNTTLSTATATTTETPKAQ